MHLSVQSRQHIGELSGMCGDGAAVCGHRRPPAAQDHPSGLLLLHQILRCQVEQVEGQVQERYQCQDLFWQNIRSQNQFQVQMQVKTYQVGARIQAEMGDAVLIFKEVIKSFK